MPRADLTVARRMKGLAGEVAALKGMGFAWTAPALRTPADPATALVINSGHSLTDTLHQGGWPGNIAAFRQRDGLGAGPYPPNVDFLTTKSTIPGSSTRSRWGHMGFPANTDARRDIALFDTLTITERGLDNVGVAFPYSLDDTSMAWQLAEDMEYLWRFVDNARRNGRVGAGAETLLWAIWPAIDGSMGPFRAMLDVYEHRWHYRQEVINRWLAEVGSPQRMFVIPGHRMMARLYDDIATGRVPGVSGIGQFFADNIHPNEAGAYAITCLWYAVVFGRSPAGYPAIAAVTSIHPDLAGYLQAAAWDVARRYARAGLGGADMGAAGILPTPANVDPAQMPGFAWQTGALVSDGAAAMPEMATAPIGGGAIYGVMAFTLDAQQAGTDSTLLRLSRSGTNELVASLNWRGDLGRLLLENDVSGGTHASHGPLQPGAPQVLEFWIDGAGSVLRGLVSTPSLSPGMRPSPNAADRLRVGWSPWGPATFKGTIHGAAFLNAKPSNDERTRLRAWAHERAGIPFRERAVPARPQAGTMADNYGVALGQIPLHLQPEDAVVDPDGNVLSVPNRGGAGAAFNAAGQGLTRSGALLQVTSSGVLRLDNPADLQGVRLFVVMRRSATGQAWFAGGPSGSGAAIRFTHSNMPDGAAASTLQLSNLGSVGPLPRSLYTLVLLEIELTAAGLRAWLNGVAAANPGPGSPSPYPLVNIGAKPPDTPSYTGLVGDIVSLITDGSAGLDARALSIRQALAAKHGIILP